MAKVSLYLDTRRAKAGGKFPLKFSVAAGHGTKILYPTGIDLSAKHWNGHEVIRHPEALLYNQLLSFKVQEISRALLDIGNTRSYTTDSLKKAVDAALSGRGKGGRLLVKDGFAIKMKLVDKPGNLAVYQRTLDKIGAYADLGCLTFRDIDYGWLCDFDAHLAGSHRVNGRALLLRTLRAVFNHLIKTGDIEADCYPFRQFQVKHEETAKLALTLEQLRTIRDHGGKYADIFMLSFYLIGINVGDLCHLKGITADGRVAYRRNKTGRLFSVKVEPEALAIIERYRGERWLLEMLDRRKPGHEDYHTFMYNFNRRIKNIIPGISSNCARHTWATMAIEIDTPSDVVRQAMGHSLGSRTTAIYIKPNPKKVDDANRKVIDYVFGK